MKTYLVTSDNCSSAFNNLKEAINYIKNVSVNISKRFYKSGIIEKYEIYEISIKDKITRLKLQNLICKANIYPDTIDFIQVINSTETIPYIITSKGFILYSNKTINTECFENKCTGTTFEHLINQFEYQTGLNHVEIYSLNSNLFFITKVDFGDFYYFYKLPISSINFNLTN